MRVIFMGTPDFAATILRRVDELHQVVAVYTRPDAVRGRGNELVASPVKTLALDLGLPVYCPSSLKDEAEQERIKRMQADCIVVAAYGMLLPQAVIEATPFGAINAHASLLPRWRGAAPVERAILAGDENVGVCAMRIDRELDAGPYCVSRSIPVAHRSATDLLDELSHLGAEALLSALAQFEAGRVFWVEQNEEEATYAPKIEKGELDLLLSDSAQLADRKVRASSNAHACRCAIADKKVSVLSAQAYAEIDLLPQGLAPGSVAYVGKRLFLGMAQGVLEIKTIKPQGKREMDAKSFAAGVQNIKNEPKYWRTFGN